MFPPIFMADTKIIYGYNFVPPFSIILCAIDREIHFTWRRLLKRLHVTLFCLIAICFWHFIHFSLDLGKHSYSYCHGKCHFNFVSGWMGFEKTFTFCCGKMLKHHILFLYEKSSKNSDTVWVNFHAVLYLMKWFEHYS